MMKEILSIGFIFAFVIFATSVIPNNAMNKECVYSNFNIFSNSTQGTYLLGRCYIPIYENYQSTEKCGTFGISCYETSEPYTRAFKYEVCFKLKTGERC